MQPESALTFSESELVERYRARLRFFAARRLSDAGAAEDVAHEALRRVLEALRAGRVENPGAISSFVFQTAVHVCLQHNRSGEREASKRWRAQTEGSAGPEAAPDSLSRIISEEERNALIRALEKLDPQDRGLLRLFYEEGVSIVEIARGQGVTPEALRVRKHRAVRRLNEILKRGSTGNVPA